MSENNNPLGTIAEIKSLVRELENALRNQNDVLQMRNMGFPPETFQALEDITSDVRELEPRVVHDTTNLGQLRTLAGTSSQINSSLDLDTVLNEAMERVIVLTGAERGYIVLADENPFELEWQVRIARDPEQEGFATPEFKGSRTILREVLETGNTLLTDNAYNDPNWGSNATIAAMSLRSVLCVPLTLKEKVIGAVYVDNRLRAGIFTAQSQLLLTAFANQAAIAIGNARLYTRVQQSIEAITELRDLMDNIFTSIGSGVMTTDDTGNVVICNPAAIQMLQCETEQIINTPVLEWLPECDVDFANEIALVRQTGDSRVLDTRFETNESELKAFNISLSPLHDGITQGVTIVLNDLTKQHENEEMLRVLRRYLSPEMVDNIHTIASLALGGERRETTCIFVDARPLSTFPVDLRPTEIMDMLNRHLSVATDCIHAVGGVIDKYMGHEIMGLFNSQLNPQPDHAARAVEAALNIRDAFVRLYDEMGIHPDPHYYRIGIHTGVATLGNVGSEIRRDFTAIGDSINLSKRLEENAGASQIIISEDIRLHIMNNPGNLSLDDIVLEEREAIQVKGRQQRTRIYEVFRAS